MRTMARLSAILVYTTAAGLIVAACAHMPKRRAAKSASAPIMRAR